MILYSNNTHGNVRVIFPNEVIVYLTRRSEMNSAVFRTGSDVLLLL